MINIKEELLVERIVNRQLKANERILIEMGETLAGLGDLTSSQAYTIAQQLKYGESLDKIVKILSETSNLTEEEIYEILEKSAKNNLALSERYFKAKKIDFIPYDKNIALQNKVKEIARATIDSYRNISSTTGIKYLDSNGNEVVKDIKEAYNELIDSSIENIALGKETFGETLKKQLETITSNGIRSIEYESGRSRRIDSAIRMNIQDGLNQLSLAQQQIVGEQFGNDGWEITVHANSAVDHEDIQGHIFENDEFNKLQDYNYFGEINDVDGNVFYRDDTSHIRPIGELNCYHRAFAIVIGVDKPIYSNKELEKFKKDNAKGFEYEGKHYTMYEGTQMQRRLETELRRNREERMVLKKSYDSVDDPIVKNELGEALEKKKMEGTIILNKYHDFSRTAGLEPELERTRVARVVPDEYIKRVSKPVEIEVKVEEEVVKKDWMKEKNLPGWYKAYDEEGKALVEYLNEYGDGSSLASKVYSKHIKGLGDGSEGMKCYATYKEGKGAFKRYGRYTEVEAPKITNKENKIGAVNTTLHENWHAIDWYKGRGTFLTKRDMDLSGAIIRDNGEIGKEIQKRFNDFNEGVEGIYDKVSKDNKHLFDELNERFDKREIKYSTYRSKWSKIINDIKNTADVEKRNYMGGGYDLLEDIYDALHAGKLRDSGVVKYGHGGKYYRSFESRAEEILANYGALSMTNPELIKLLKEDKPELCKALDKLLRGMMK